MQKEERLWDMWSRMATSPYVGDGFPSFNQFKEEHGLETYKNKDDEKQEIKSNYKGDDLTSFV